MENSSYEALDQELYEESENGATREGSFGFGHTPEISMNRGLPNFLRGHDSCNFPTKSFRLSIVTLGWSCQQSSSDKTLLSIIESYPSPYLSNSSTIKANKTNTNNISYPTMTTHHILAICTSSEITSYGATTGIWLDELATPFYVWQEAGYDVTICSIAGRSPSIDPGSMNDTGSLEGSIRRFLTDPDAQHKFTNALSLAQIIAAGKINTYSCIYLVGGHGCLEDFPDNVDIKEAVEYFYADVGGCLASICHGPLGLLNCMYDRAPLLKGKFVAAFSNEEESLLGLDTSVRMKVEDCMDQAGAGNSFLFRFYSISLL